MLTNSCGFPLLEGNDYASPAALRMIAEEADAHFAQQEVDLDLLERPEVALATLPANQACGATGSGTPVNFDTMTYLSRPTAYASNGFSLDTSWRPGIYNIGGFVDVVTVGAVTSMWVDLLLEDRRGPRLLNQYSEYARAVEGNTIRGAIALSCSQLVEIHDPWSSTVSMMINMVGAGSLVVQSYSKMWIRRIRGLSDV